MKTCIFCNADLAIVGKAKEHIIPRWLQEEWKLSNQIIEPTHFSEKGEVQSQRRHTLDSFLSGSVCCVCNNGWMSKLETETKDLILLLASGKRRILELEDNEALLLARWTVKTAFSLHTAANWRRVIPENHFSKLDKADYRLPPNVFVVGHTYKGSKKFSWAQSTTWPIFARGHEVTEPELQTIKESGYKISLRLGGLFLMVFYNPIESETVRTCLWKYRHVPLYPRWSHPVAWQMQDLAWPSNVEARFQVFHQELSLSIDGVGEK